MKLLDVCKAWIAHHRPGLSPAEVALEALKFFHESPTGNLWHVYEARRELVLLGLLPPDGSAEDIACVNDEQHDRFELARGPKAEIEMCRRCGAIWERALPTETAPTKEA